MRRLAAIALLALATPVDADVAVPLTVAAPSGFRVAGRVHWRGPVPKIPAPATDYRDPACPPPSNRQFQIGGGEGGVADVYVFIEELHGWKSAEPTRVALFHDGCEFSPRVSVAPPGSLLVNGNRDRTIHNTHAYMPLPLGAPLPQRFVQGKGFEGWQTDWGRSLFNVAVPAGSPPNERRVEAQGLVRLRCDVHPWEEGFLILSDRPYFAVTKLDGEFAIENVPSGTWHLKAWHDGLPALDRVITVGKDAAGRLDLELGPQP